MTVTIEEEKNEMIYSIADVMNDLEYKRKNGLKKGSFPGFDKMYEHYSVQRGTMTFIIAGAGHGKTSFLYELLINLAQFEGKKVAIFSPEAGSVADLYGELLWAYLKKPFMKHEVAGVPQASEEEVKAGYKFMEEHFFVIDSGLKEMNADYYFRALLDLEKERGVKIDLFVLEPITELNYNLMNEREDVALGKFLTKFRKHASTHGMHGFLSVHTKAQQPISATLPSGEKIFYTPPPTYTDTSGGMMFSRKGYQILSIWRCPVGLINPETEEPYRRNETIVSVLKVKPKIAGKLGKFSLFYDWSTNRFKDENGDFSYSMEESSIYGKKKKITKQGQIPF